MDVVGDEFFVGEDHAAEAAALAVDMLGRGIDDDVGAEFESGFWRSGVEKTLSTMSRAGLACAISATRRCRSARASGSRAFEEERLVSGLTAFLHWFRSRPSTRVEVIP